MNIHRSVLKSFATLEQTSAERFFAVRAVYVRQINNTPGEPITAKARV